MMDITRKAIEEIETIKKQKQNVLALVRGGHAQPKGMTTEEAIKLLIAEIDALDVEIIEITQMDARVDIEIRSRFFT
jgi:hypothetical protein